MKNKVSHFEIPADDLERAKDFYGKVFGWQFKSWDDDYIMVTAADSNAEGMSDEKGAINGGLQKRSDRAIAPTIVIQTDDIDSILEEVYAQGGETAIEKEKIGDMGFYAQFNDTEGNRIGLFQENK